MPWVLVFTWRVGVSIGIGTWGRGFVGIGTACVRTKFASAVGLGIDEFAIDCGFSILYCPSNSGCWNRCCRWECVYI